MTVLRRAGRSSEKGQAILVLLMGVGFLMAGLALVIDLGWAFYHGRRAQMAADAAALAAAQSAWTTADTGTLPTCGSAACQASSPCPASGNLQIGCQYAQRNGYSSGGDSGRQSVQMSAGTDATPPGLPGVPVAYWVKAQTSHRLPAWFGTFVGSTGLTPTASAIAAVRPTSFANSLYLLNRTSDCFASLLNLGSVCGEDFLALGGNTVVAESPIFMASSNSSGVGLPGVAAASSVGSLSVTAPATYLVGRGGVQALGATSWNSAPQNGFPDTDLFADPMAGKGQPPMATGLSAQPVTSGVINGSVAQNRPTVLSPGVYYAAAPLTGAPLGTPVTISGNVIFSDGAGTPCNGFCEYVFVGGLVTAPQANVTVSPGRYVFAGVPIMAGTPQAGLTLGVGTKLMDLTGLNGGAISRNSDAGEIFIFTNGAYPGLALPPVLQATALAMTFARAGIYGGVNQQVALHGLNSDSAAVPPSLRPFAPTLIWQDQANTTVKYKPNGRIDVSCGGTCPNTLAVPGTNEMVLTGSGGNGHASTNLYGAIYGPRGSYLTILGLLNGDTVSGPLQIITGSLQMTANTRLNLQKLPNPIKQYTVSLIH